ncbi:uncharacterized protein GGS25DRAFT_529510 [Hypoxylon fragiforme]|uniref:uncharacterized protein n=1 Tax=Hypoxylon fragiforme TaxID=63214 RepID=UPI0020C6608F|nr:uncharacterized protein GGS25DRAFT_529510 [Hypoxylon fragiforme]KAI2613076.1 hypothetical protein GGS25DRAFT_529510 [Hypoxylon fragiforme]
MVALRTILTIALPVTVGQNPTAHYPDMRTAVYRRGDQHLRQRRGQQVPAARGRVQISKRPILQRSRGSGFHVCRVAGAVHSQARPRRHADEQHVRTNNLRHITKCFILPSAAGSARSLQPAAYSFLFSGSSPRRSARNNNKKKKTRRQQQQQQQTTRVGGQAHQQRQGAAGRQNPISELPTSHTPLSGLDGVEELPAQEKAGRA